MRTSKTDPIRVDFLPETAGALAGRLGLTIAPGKKDKARHWDRDLGDDLGRLRDTYRASVLVILVEEHELAHLGIKDLAWKASQSGMRVQRLPIVDAGVPERADDVVALVRVMLAAAEAGDVVVVHCRGGLGRSGLVAACALVAQGSEPGAAIRVVRQARPGAIENWAQETFVRTFASVWRGAAPARPSASRFLGCLLGGAVGDALGYPVEFHRTAADIERVLGPAAPERLPRARGKKALVSDDTQMTLFTAEGLVRAWLRYSDRGICSYESVLLRAYQRWLFTQGEVEVLRDGPHERGWLLDVPQLKARRAPGNTCLSALRSTLGGREVPSVEAPPNDSKGCGAVMRSAPIGLAAGNAEGAFHLARDAGALTHGHPSGYLSAAYFAALVHGLARDVPLTDAMATADELLREQQGSSEVRRAVQAARASANAGVLTRETIEALGGGWVGEEALGIALLCALSTEDGSPGAVGESLWKSVAHAGDSDSTGSLTGNLLGAMFGVDCLPAAWLEDLEMRDIIERMARDLHATFVLGLEPDRVRYPPV